MPASDAERPTALDRHLWNEGTHERAWECLGAHLRPGRARFGVWAPNATAVSVVGDWNGWDPGRDRLDPVGQSGIWSGVAPGAARGQRYKYRVVGRDGRAREKADPFAFRAELPPRTASEIWPLDFEWHDGPWRRARAARHAPGAPIAIYELHLGSWRRGPGGRWLTYDELAGPLVDHVRRNGFTHVELLPVMEHPFYGSWGYQPTGYFAPTARYGEPQGLMRLIDALHRAGIGVLLDWAPAHFPDDPHGLGCFDGTHCYEHADPRRGRHPDWDSCCFNYGRHEVRSFLLSSARFWLDVYHADGLRMDAVASMLYLDYSRRAGEWTPNAHGGREHLEAIAFLRECTTRLRAAHPDALLVAEESTAWPGVSAPPEHGGLGFHHKWDLGWMHDVLDYVRRDPVHRRWHHRALTFRGLYAHTERFVLPLSHDEVVHGKGSLLARCPGDDWQRFATLRLLLAWQHAQPGKKLLFMGGEFGQRAEWWHETELDWGALSDSRHAGVQRWVADCNALYREAPALHAIEEQPGASTWVDADSADDSVVALLRWGRPGDRPVLVACNFTPVPRMGRRIGVPWAGPWRERLNSDAGCYGGSGMGNAGRVEARPQPWQGQQASVTLTLPPLAALFLEPA